MKVDKEKKRLKAIKLKYVLCATRCACCGEEFKFERMWHVYRYDSTLNCDEYYYCRRCTPSAKDVLKEIDTDECIFGIVGVDNIILCKRKIISQ